MINHVRCHLLNARAGTAPDWAIGEELIDPAYGPVATMPTALAEVRRRIFGATPDRSMLNYRLAQLLRLIHATELSKFFTRPDPRITYLGHDVGDLLSNAAFMPVINGSPATQIAGVPLNPDANGRMYFAFDVLTTGAQAVVTQRMPTPKNQILNYTTVDGLSTTLIPLGGTGYSFLASAARTAFSVSFHLRPTWDLGQIALALHQAGEPNLLALFGDKLVEPYKTFSNLFYDHPEVAYQLGGIVLALAYRTDEVRRGI